MAGRSLLQLAADLLTAVLGVCWPLAVLLLGALPVLTRPEPLAAILTKALWAVAAVTGVAVGIRLATALLRTARRPRDNAISTSFWSR